MVTRIKIILFKQLNSKNLNNFIARSQIRNKHAKVQLKIKILKKEKSLSLKFDPKFKFAKKSSNINQIFSRA